MSGYSGNRVEPQCAGAAADRADVEDESGSADCLCDG